MSEVVKVGIAEMGAALPPDTIRTTGLGSCVGVILYDEIKKIAGMAHVMLPDSSLARSVPIKTGKYADTAIVELYHQLLKLGAHSHRLRAKIAGGAQMFQFKTGSEMMRIGPRNVESVKIALEKLDIPIVASDVGGSNGRTIEFDPDRAELTIKTVNHGTKIL